MSYAQGKDWALIQADCLRALAVFPENRFDSCVTDPPYELGFMGKGWDASGIAARLEARGFLGIEREPDYFTIAEARIRGAA